MHLPLASITIIFGDHLHDELTTTIAIKPVLNIKRSSCEVDILFSIHLVNNGRSTRITQIARVFSSVNWYPVFVNGQ